MSQDERASLKQDATTAEVEQNRVCERCGELLNGIDDAVTHLRDDHAVVRNVVLRNTARVDVIRGDADE